MKLKLSINHSPFKKAVYLGSSSGFGFLKRRYSILPCLATWRASGRWSRTSVRCWHWRCCSRRGRWVCRHGIWRQWVNMTLHSIDHLPVISQGIIRRSGIIVHIGRRTPKHGGQGFHYGNFQECRNLSFHYHQLSHTMAMLGPKSVTKIMQHNTNQCSTAQRYQMVWRLLNHVSS